MSQKISYNNSILDKLKNINIIIQFVWYELNKQVSSIVFSVKANTDSKIQRFVNYL